ncbi:hypothetical protein CDD81_1386 [Ophiocordyceps australis]|uniref:CID domain-containing protein n=1 Tax=Ophiocordyceps australis TaxID=1399860 RepID=A0A2C5XTN4_9HYPO|nr:hypothetical protein CDD81_1386 [Ophiocordyceps australis]
MASSNTVAELEAGLQGMLELKPPGVSKKGVDNLTKLCIANIQSESVLIQKVYTHFKKAPGTHKLGVLYVVDLVTRKWLERAKAQGQPVNSSAQDGTYAAGVNRVTELMPVLMNDVIQSAPDEQKDKIKKLLDIWEKAQTFPAPMLQASREKLSSVETSNPTPPNASTTPPGSPPTGLPATSNNNAAGSAVLAAPNGASILEALANIARQTAAATPAGPAAAAAPAPSAVPSYNAPAQLPSLMPQQQPQAMPVPSFPPAATPSSLPYSVSQQILAQGGVQLPAIPGPNGQPPNAYAAAPAQGLDSTTHQQIMLIKALAEQGVPFDKIPALVQSMTGAGQGASQPSFQPPIPAAQGTFPTGQQPWAGPVSGVDGPRDRGYLEHGQSPARFHGRSRSRSPDRGWGVRGSPRGGDDHDRNGRRGHDYRQRSPQGRRGRSDSPLEFPPIERWIDYDPSLPAGHIRVLSRTLFVGGVTCTEADLRRIFSRYGIVQTCIVNKEKRHAFVKMLTRKDAVNAKDSTEDSRNLELPLRTRWGVGFGPRDCSDYSSGISVIPIHKLTEADRKWLLTAPYGGSGGRPIETGMCVEEPDIEIGAGVSSKAISRRMQTDKGGSNGPKSTRNREDDNGRGRRGRDFGGNQQRRNDQGDQGSATGYPFDLSGMSNGMPNFASGFAYPNSGNGN